MVAPPFRVKAVYDYSSPHDDDLSFPIGQIINVTDEEDADWYYGEYLDSVGGKHEGLFPRNFVKIYEPETPPRPSRASRSKKDMEPAAVVDDAGAMPENDEAGTIIPQTNTLPSSASTVEQSGQAKVEEQSSLNPDPKSPMIASAPPPTKAASKPAPAAPPKPTDSADPEKTTGGSFRDRIAAFNKPKAPPVAPIKPSGLGISGDSGFVKKPFVALPPSKNAYVAPIREPPPQKAYRREEDPEVVAQTSNDAETEEHPNLPAPTASAEIDEDQPKPTSLKDRIALLQKQQMEQAARHAEGAQKKEKLKRPPKKQVESHEVVGDLEVNTEGEALERLDSAETLGKHSIDTAHDDVQPRVISTTRPREPNELALVSSPAGAPKDILSDGNDADQSGAGDTEEDVSTGRDDSDEKPRGQAPSISQRAAQAHPQETAVGNEEEDVEEDEDEEEEDVDPEYKRKMELRERMAKMSGGMGMAGMFGPPGGVPQTASKKQKPAPGGTSERKASGSRGSGMTDSPVSRAPPVPMIPMPGMQKFGSPEEEPNPLEVGKEAQVPPRSITQGRKPGDVPEVENVDKYRLPMPRRSMEHGAPPHVPQDRPAPAPPTSVRGAPPPVPNERPVPPPPAEFRTVPRTPTMPMSPSPGSESDDEMSQHTRRLSVKVPESNSSRQADRDNLPPMPSNAPVPSLVNRPQGPQTRTSDYEPSSPHYGPKDSSPTVPTTPGSAPKRSSRVPPIPGSSPAIAFTPQNRAPPPPPPTNAPPSRTGTGDSKGLLTAPNRLAEDDSDEEVTEYEGDYDTDMAPGATHPEALKSHGRVSSLEEGSLTDEASLHHSALPSLGPPLSSAGGASRALPPPPPPPNQPPKNNRQSGDMPRAAPPPPPPPREVVEDDEDEPYERPLPKRGLSVGYEGHGRELPRTPNVEDQEDDLYAASSPQNAMPLHSSQNPSPYTSPPTAFTSSKSMPRQSLDVQRANTNTRRSMDAPRPSGEQGFIASDVDLGHSSQWWAHPNVPPPVFQNRRDIVFEIEESSTTRRGGRKTITKDVYALYMDYSQTVVTVNFETKDPADASLEQRHEPPPVRLRQDQLEDAHSRFGTSIAEGANAKQNTVVDDGTSHALVLDLMKSFPEALLPVGSRAYGALVYANLANASVQHFDEIRSGDIVTFRNAKFQGHRGPMHQKYNIEVGKPDHVGVVVDWDGTKKKVRAWEQGRESKKVKIESFKLGDLRSGEVKVWRVMPRAWVGWEGQN